MAKDYGKSFDEYVTNRAKYLVEEKDVDPELANTQAAGEFLIKLQKQYKKNPPTPPEES